MRPRSRSAISSCEPRAGRFHRTPRGAGDGLLDRFARVVKSNVNRAIQRIEDPEKVLDQAADEMQEDLIRVRQSYAQVLATQRRVAEQRRVHEGLAQSWYERAELAVEKGSDELAKEALTRRQAAIVKAADLERQLQTMDDNVDRLFEAVQALEAKIDSAKNEKEQLVARARAAKSTAQVNDMLSEVGQIGGAGAFNRMKEKVEMLEAEAEVSQGLLPNSLPRGSAEEQFRQLEAGDAIDDELSKLKGSRALLPVSAEELDAAWKKLEASDE